MAKLTLAKMTLEERKAAAGKEICDLLDWSLKEEVKITENLKTEGKFKPGLDGNSEDYALLNKEIENCVEQIFQKYNIPLKTKLKLW